MRLILRHLSDRHRRRAVTPSTELRVAYLDTAAEPPSAGLIVAYLNATICRTHISGMDPPLQNVQIPYHKITPMPNGWLPCPPYLLALKRSRMRPKERSWFYVL